MAYDHHHPGPRENPRSDLVDTHDLDLAIVERPARPGRPKDAEEAMLLSSVLCPRPAGESGGVLGSLGWGYAKVRVLRGRLALDALHLLARDVDRARELVHP